MTWNRSTQYPTREAGEDIGDAALIADSWAYTPCCSRRTRANVSEVTSVQNISGVVRTTGRSPSERAMSSSSCRR
jgi:hypothetical protein